MRLPDLIAHRGYPRLYPENTLPGIEAALTAGARYVEVDVQITADGVPVVFHDRTLARLCNAPGAVHERTVAELRGLVVRGPGERSVVAGIPTLEAVAGLFQCTPLATLFVEIKRVALERFGILDVLRPVAAALGPIRERAVLISFDLDVLLVARWNGWPALGIVVEHWADRENPIVAKIAPDYLFCDVEGLPADGALRFAGARIVVYEVADPLLAMRLANRGVDLVETFAIGEMLRAMGGRANV